MGDVPFYLKFALKPKSAYIDQYLLITSEPQWLAKNVQLLRIGSRRTAFQRAIDKVRTLPLTPQKVAEKANLSFLCIQPQSDPPLHQRPISTY